MTSSHWLILTITLSWITALIEFFSLGRLHIIIPYLIVSPFLIILPRMIYYWHARTRGRGSIQLVSNIEKSLFIVILLNAPASLFLHNLGFQYDRFLHLMMGVAYGYAFILTLTLLLRHPENLMTGASFGFLIFVGIAMLFLWEGGQFSIDVFSGTLLFHDATQPIIQDFWEDILFGFTGGAIILSYVKPRWHHLIQTQIQPT